MNLMNKGDQDDWNRADEILGADWMDPGYKWFLDAWEQHSERTLLDERKAEVDENGMPTWHAVRIHDVEDDFIEYWQRPIDEEDEREATCVISFPKKRYDDAIRDAQAIVDEHADPID